MNDKIKNPSPEDPALGLPHMGVMNIWLEGWNNGILECWVENPKVTQFENIKMTIMYLMNLLA